MKNQKGAKEIDINNLSQEHKKRLEELRKVRYTKANLQHQNNLLEQKNNIKKYLTEVNDPRKVIEYNEIISYVRGTRKNNK